MQRELIQEVQAAKPEFPGLGLCRFVLDDLGGFRPDCDELGRELREAILLSRRRGLHLAGSPNQICLGAGGFRPRI